MNESRLAETNNVELGVVLELEALAHAFRGRDQCVEIIRKGIDEIKRLQRREFICSKCSLRKDGEKPNVEF